MAAFQTYVIRHFDGTGNLLKSYVGVTTRTLEKRLSAHFAEASRGERSISPHSLGYAIRDEIRSLKEDARSRFTIEGLALHGSRDEMLAAESRWIEELHTAAPEGYNIMPGGSSAGGVGNSKAISLVIDGQVQEFTSISEASTLLATATCQDPAKFLARVYERLRSGNWTLAEAFDLQPHQDGRSSDLKRQAEAAGVPLARVKSQHHRSLKKQHQEQLPRKVWLPHPNQSGEMVSIAQFCKITGAKKSSLTRRLKEIWPIDRMEPGEVIKTLSTLQDRRKIIEVTVGGKVHRGGQNELAEEFRSDGTKTPGRYSHATIRRRLGELPDDATNDDKLRAVGHLAWLPNTKLIAVEPVRHKKRFHEDWSVAHQGFAVRQATQMSFVRWTIAHSESAYARAEPSSLQKEVSKLAKKGFMPWQIAFKLGVPDVAPPQYKDQADSEPVLTPQLS